ncbi:MAG: ribonuclease III [Planctomycetota bacterium]|jgi:ribonuclease-3|nr:ribonuclease III [Planctomycetota bacterium]
MHVVPDLDQLESILGYTFKDRVLLARALTHSSMRSPSTPCNERLEFLGDSILGMIVSELLYDRLPRASEGELTRIKSVIVSRSCIGQQCQDMGLYPFIGLGKGISSRSDLPTSIFANVFEALIAALYIDGGTEEARRFIIQHLGSVLECMLETGSRQNHKSILQDYCQKNYGVVPLYTILREEGPDHCKEFELHVEFLGKSFPSATGRRKKEAEQLAAQKALEVIETEDFQPPSPL